jgi:hypothetical protein
MVLLCSGIRSPSMADLYVPENLHRWNDSDPAWGTSGNYVGADLSEFYQAPCSITRDTADSLSLSNWRVITEELQGLARHEETGITRMGHWACGWYELFLIHETDREALERADQWAADLESYPVADESHLSELEQELEQEEWERNGESDWRAAIAEALERYAPADSDIYWGEELADTLSDEKLQTSWHELIEQCSHGSEHTSEGCCLNIEGPAELLTAAKLSEIFGQTFLTADQRWRFEPYPWAGAAPAPLLA